MTRFGWVFRKILWYLNNNNLKSQRAWNEQYLNGDWDCLASELEECRFAAVRNSIDKHCNQKSKVLDVGCGAGLLLKNAKHSIFDQYIGIDISNVAIERARTNKKSNIKYICADMENYYSATKFDMIIFNESLYYSKNPHKLINRYVEFLNKGGYLIFSIFEAKNHLNLIRGLQKDFPAIETTRSNNKRGSWYCHVHKI
ncbi:class I SAM-dependent methyltransferase [Pedobacter roseus]|uniref:Class I SAM-dependent methyltransferase n=1 Tax=Pedobacter roseus TaxID=336820 RepID=A0A7G9QKT2_9SPHI|nr:class I SAM-dependent methyltransferase [Pedobacter roseus]QNN43957.1 class I SAM-dependent methyltransferase [Pedobacter roseus]